MFGCQTVEVALDEFVICSDSDIAWGKEEKGQEE
jgi:hypothetical protein